MSRIKNTNTLSVLMIVLLLGFPQISETIYTPSLPDLARSLGVGDDWAEFTLSIYFIGFAVGVFLWGVIADWIGRRPAMLWGLILYGIGSWGCYQSEHIITLLAWRFIQACGASAGSVVTQTMIRDLYAGAKRNQIFSIVGAALALSPAIGPFIGGWVDEYAGWRGNFAFLVGMGLVLLIYTFIKLPETAFTNQKQRALFGQIARQLIQDKRVLGYALLIGGCNGIIFSFYAEAPFLFIDLMGFTPAQYGLFGIVIASGSLIASFISHRLNGGGMKPEQILSMGSALMGLAAISLVGAAKGGFFDKVSLVHMIMILSMIGMLFIGIGLVIPNALGQSLGAYQQAIGTAGAFFGFAYYVIIAGLTCLMGFLHDGTALPMPLYFLALVAVIGWAIYGLILPKTVICQI